MKINLIEQILKERNNKITHLQSPVLRAESLKKLEQIEYDNINLIYATQKGLIEMLNRMDKTELLGDIDYTIILLDYFTSNNSFNLKNIPINKVSQDLSAKHNRIKTVIMEIVETKQKDESSGFIK